MKNISFNGSVGGVSDILYLYNVSLVTPNNYLQLTGEWQKKYTTINFCIKGQENSFTQGHPIPGSCLSSIGEFQASLSLLSMFHVFQAFFIITFYLPYIPGIFVITFYVPCVPGILCHYFLSSIYLF